MFHHAPSRESAIVAMVAVAAAAVFACGVGLRVAGFLIGCLIGFLIGFAVFFAVFVACLWAAFVPEGRRLAVLVVGISMVSFLVLYWQAGSPAPLRKIANVDLAGLPVLAGVAWLAFRQ